MVHYVFKLHAAPESLVRVIIVMPFYHNGTDENIAGEVFKQFNKWTTRAPPSWGGFFNVNNYPIQGGQRGVTTLVLLKLGQWDKNTTADLQEFFDLKESLPVGFLTPFWISNISSYWDFGKELSGDFDPRSKRSYTMGTLVPAENHDADFGEFIAKEFLDDGDVPISCAMTRLGGEDVLIVTV